MAARKKRRTPAQIRATRRMVAANRSRRRAPVRRRRNPISRGKAAAYNAVPMANPIRRRRRSASSRIRRRRNPINTGMNFILDSLKGSLWGAGGAVIVDAVVGMVPLPDQMKTGYIKYGTKALLSGLAGWAASKVIDRRSAKSIAAGGLTVALYQAASKAITENVPGVTLGYYNASMNAGSRLGAYTLDDSALLPGGNVLNSLAPGASTQLAAYTGRGRSW